MPPHFALVLNPVAGYNLDMTILVDDVDVLVQEIAIALGLNTPIMMLAIKEIILKSQETMEL